MDMITIDDFKKVELKVARILEVNPHPNADKLYVVKIDTGAQQKQIVAGIKNFYRPQDLVGKLVVIVDNLPPVVLRGVESQAMLLAASSGEQMSILTLDKPVSLGSQIK